MWGEVEAAGSINDLLLSDGEVGEDGEAGQVDLRGQDQDRYRVTVQVQTPSWYLTAIIMPSYQSYGLVLGSGGDGEDLRGGVKCQRGC